MAKAISKAQLDGLVDTLNRMTGNRFDFSLNYHSGSVRLERKSGSVDVSPRTGKTELYYWMHAYIDGIELGSGQLEP